MNIKKLPSAASSSSNANSRQLHEIGDSVRLTKDVEELNSSTTMKKGTLGMISHVQVAHSGSVFYTVTFSKKQKWLSVEPDEIELARPQVKSKKAAERFETPPVPADTEHPAPPSPSASQSRKA